MNLVSIILLVAILVIVTFLVTVFNKNRTKKLKIPKENFPVLWRTILQEKVVFYQRLTAHEQRKFENRVHLFLVNIEIKGIDTEVTHLDRILIASGAIIPIFRFEHWHYGNLQCIELHADQFPIPNTNQFAHGLVGWGAMQGKMKLSRKAIIHGFYHTHDQKNVVIHEFVHVLDMQDGNVDGILKDIMLDIDIKPWLQLLQLTTHEINSNKSSIRDYGKTNPAEFLAVVSEYFFESPEKLKQEHPELYQKLESFYHPKNRLYKYVPSALTTWHSE